MVAKLAGKVLTVMVVPAGRLKLFRCLQLEGSDDDEILSMLLPTFAYAEDELGTQVKKLVLCGFPHAAGPVEAESYAAGRRSGRPQRRPGRLHGRMSS